MESKLLNPLNLKNILSKKGEQVKKRRIIACDKSFETFEKL
jgi:hypothetical protein